MPTKSDRILSYLPGTFKRSPQQSALFAIVDAFGSELLRAENSLAAVMQAHWVDHADKGAGIIEDLAFIASLYGLAPRCREADDMVECALPPGCDETVEEFRQHLKRYIRTFLEGTVTVQGILRVTAEALALHIADDYAEMDTWWTPGNETLLTAVSRGDGAAQRLFGFANATAQGQPDRPAQMDGTVDLSRGVDLGDLTVLHLQVNNRTPIPVDLAKAGADQTAVMLDELEAAINQAVGNEPIASHNGRFLRLTAPQTGPDSRLTILPASNDAAEKVLGLKPTVYSGTEARPATVSSRVDLSGGADLQTEHFFRLVLNGTQTEEIALPAGATVSLDQLQAAINDAVGAAIATHDGRFLTITSPTTGVSSSIAWQQPAAQNATARLFGSANSFHQGQNAQPAQIIGAADLSSGVDLRHGFNLRFSLDGAKPITVNCAGENPANTRLAEIIAAINTVVGETVARQNGRFLTIASSTNGPDSSLVFETPEEADATELLLGIKPRSVTGTAATAAHLEGRVDLSQKPENLNLLAQNHLRLAVDGRMPVKIDLRSNAASAQAVTLTELVTAINSTVGQSIASHNNQQLHLTSVTAGRSSRLQIEPLEATQSRRFVTRAKIIDEAAQTIFGFVDKEASGHPATSARVAGQKDLSRGVDLRDNQFLRLTIDSKTVDIDCGGRRLRATLLHEIVTEINKAFGKEVALDNGKNLILQSQTTGTGSRIAFAPPQATDALPRLLGVEPGLTRGQGASTVRLLGIPDLSQGITLPAGASLRLGVDGDAPVPIVLTEEEVTISLNQLILGINAAVNHNIASHDGTHLIISSLLAGAGSQLDIANSGDTDVTKTLLGISPPRTYYGKEPIPARIVGQADLRGSIDLHNERFLQIGLNGGEPVPLDCALNVTNSPKATLGNVVDAINAQMPAPIASSESGHLVLTSPTTGSASQIVLMTHTAGDAREKLFGAVPEETIGDAPTPATITGEVDLLSPVDLSERARLRLVVDGDWPIEINVAGSVPEATSLDEIVAAINSVQPGLASPTEDDRLQLRSPSSGTTSQLAIKPLRYLEMIEYPRQPEPNTWEKPVQHGDTWRIHNQGAADSYTCVSFTNPHGAAGITLINNTIGWQFRLRPVLATGETVLLWRDDQNHLQVTLKPVRGEAQAVPGSSFLVGSLGTQMIVPATGTWHLAGKEIATLQLNNPTAPQLVQLRALKAGEVGRSIQVTVIESQTVGSQPGTAWEDGQDVQLIGRIQKTDEQWLVTAGNGSRIAKLELGARLHLEPFIGCVTAVTGMIQMSDPPTLVAHTAARLFDVTIHCKQSEGEPETYRGVTIGGDPEAETSLFRQINVSKETKSRLVTAVLLNKADLLYLPKGRSDWAYLDCPVARFNEANFDHANFPGDTCEERGIFNLSRFSNAPPEKNAPVFASSEPSNDSPTSVTFSWQIHQPAAFIVNLPADLPPRFGGRFNQARFSQGPKSRETYSQAVAEPKDDPVNLVTLIQNKAHSLVTAAFVDIVPSGWAAVALPFRQAQFLTLGSTKQEARLYLSEEGLDGFIQISAREPGSWGNAIAVTARPGGPAMYDVCILYEGGRFENARDVVRGQPPAALTKEMLKASPVGILQAKAAGVQAEVTRTGAD
ncbi:MAG: hypothetical protein H6656_00595 [Ardenticatenaceae bacterium]|nr:hypothetical protein [Anaerolineales bacterium]MCB9005882.1 hypothetical protein [Ardenticatenaceae bacterium]